MLPLFTAAALALNASSTHVYRFYGYAYSASTGKYLYTEVHSEHLNARGRWLGGTITYYAPNGLLIAKETLDFRSNPFIPICQLHQNHPNYSAGITKITSDRIYLFRKLPDGSLPEYTHLRRENNMAADLGFNNIIVENFNRLMSGDELDFSLVVLSQLSSYHFAIRRISDQTFEGHKAIRFKLELSSLLNLFTEPLIVSYDPITKRPLQYVGMSNIINPSTGQVYQRVRIEYYSKPPPNAPKQLPPLQ